MSDRLTTHHDSWTFEEALAFVKQLEMWLEPAGFHAAMTGSVLSKGQSNKDLDLVLFPHDTSKIDMSFLRYSLGKAGLEPVHSRAKVAALWERQRSNDTKHVEVWAYRNKRVDLFFLR